MPGKDKPQPDRPKKRDTPKKVQQQLQGKRCNHDRKTVTTNSKGRKFVECLQCGAFLGWT